MYIESKCSPHCYTTIHIARMWPNLRMYTCVCVRKYVYMYVYQKQTHICFQSYACACVHVCMVCMCAYVHVCMVCMCAYVHVCMCACVPTNHDSMFIRHCVCMYACMHVCMYAPQLRIHQPHSHIHVNTHSHTHLWAHSSRTGR
jgi:hypothetical protein